MLRRSAAFIQERGVRVNVKPNGRSRGASPHATSFAPPSISRKAISPAQAGASHRRRHPRGLVLAHERLTRGGRATRHRVVVYDLKFGLRPHWTFVGPYSGARRLGVF